MVFNITTSTNTCNLSLICTPLLEHMKNEMGGACGTYGGGERCAQGSGGET